MICVPTNLPPLLTIGIIRSGPSIFAPCCLIRLRFRYSLSTSKSGNGVTSPIIVTFFSGVNSGNKPSPRMISVIFLKSPHWRQFTRTSPMCSLIQKRSFPPQLGHAPCHSPRANCLSLYAAIMPAEYSSQYGVCVLLCPTMCCTMFLTIHPWLYFASHRASRPFLARL